jgi:hypothetical protein
MYGDACFMFDLSRNTAQLSPLCIILFPNYCNLYGNKCHQAILSPSTQDESFAVAKIGNAWVQIWQNSLNAF